MKFSYCKEVIIALAGVAQWIKCQPRNQRVSGLIPSEGTLSGFQARSPVVGV